MLKALELHGFKSFPDRTRFDFPPGITVVVGPNGSGKSNIVDAIKWVLGEQSAKNMRGKEMADVIFKGTAGTGGRKPANTAEATIVLDNRQRRLSMDADEIMISRRVYRSGEGEYLINGEPSRLKDIRNLIRGTGVGTDAYSLIEQGKVDQMLKSSPKERRLMFEEAAGISRFKAKKVEAERRLARVEQNLVRLADIVEEVGNAYRRIKAQASKASRYKELTERLQSLRTHVGAKDWRDFTQHLEKIDRETTELKQRLDSQQSELKSIEEESHQVDIQLSKDSGRLVELQDGLNARLQKITQQQSHSALHQSRVDDLTVQSQQQRNRLQTDNENLDQLVRRQQEAENQLKHSKAVCEQAHTALTEVEKNIDELKQSVQAAQQAESRHQSERAELTRETNELDKQISAQKSQQELLQQSKEKLLASLQRLATQLEERSAALRQLEQAQRLLEEEAAQKDSALRQSQQDLQNTREERETLQKELAECRRRHAGLTQRAEVIEELEKRLEGVDSGVKQLLEESQTATDGPLSAIRGMVADIIKVNVQHAELVDLALGDYAQALVVQGDELKQELAQGTIKLSGRVRLLTMNQPPSLGADRSIDLSSQHGVMGRLDQLVQVEGEYQEFVSHLLGGTWLVKSLEDALNCHVRSTRLITLQGDLIDPDGVLIAGPRSSAVGLVSRRSELRVLKREAAELDQDIIERVAQLQKCEQDCKRLEKQSQTFLNEHSEIATKLSDHRAKAESLSQQLDELKIQKSNSESESRQVEANLESAIKAVTQAESQCGTNRQRLDELKSQLDEIHRNNREREEQIAESVRKQTASKVALAKAEQQLQTASAESEQLQSQTAHSRQSIQTNRNELAQYLWSQRASRREIVLSVQLLETLTVEKESFDSQLQELNAQRKGIEDRRKELAQRARSIRDEIRKWNDQLHQIELKQNQLSLEREQLAQRLKDDYGIEIAELESSQELDEDREAIDREISELRRSIGNIGSVNMDALAELEETQQRFESLDAQYQDLVQSKLALEKIIQKINQDSRRLFVETLEAIRQNFQKLFRQTFGGGKADLVLEEGVDVLEAGIDIVATPPGKPEFNNSLLSGGERALTAVSLLMAIFQFRPSPFCVLDEVDAPFDEANVGRFIDVLKSFLDWTKFIIVTHSKRTMTAATTLYGVTMQESGVSKRVSVRFEDVNEKGEISLTGPTDDSSSDLSSSDSSSTDRSSSDDDDQRTVA